ncbi:MAG: hypothetical protein NVS1B7_8250 [Candidatus Saccharimonadales bacterium]
MSLLESYAAQSVETLLLANTHLPEVPHTIANFAIITYLATPNPQVLQPERSWANYARLLYHERTGEALPLRLPDLRAWRRLGRLAASSFELAKYYEPSPTDLAAALLHNDDRVIRYPRQPTY